MRYWVIELHEYDPDNRTEQQIRWGETFGEAPTLEEAESIAVRLLTQPQGQPFEALGIYDTDEGTLSVPALKLK